MGDSVPCGSGGGAARQAGGALGVGDQLAEPEEHVLVAGQLGEAGPLHHLRQGVQGERGDVGARRRRGCVQRLELRAPGRGSAGRAS